VDDRFTLGILIRGKLPWDEDPEVSQNVVVCSFLPHTNGTLSTYRPCTTGYRLRCGDSIFQLYNKHVGDSFVFLTRESVNKPLAASIALQKISARVQRVSRVSLGGTYPLSILQQIGRIRRESVTAVEMHVVSNRDRVAHQLFDLWFEQ
jgi:hypothetical protein